MLVQIVCCEFYKFPCKINIARIFEKKQCILCILQYLLKVYWTQQNIPLIMARWIIFKHLFQYSLMNIEENDLKNETK
jgi:hypothetical protein